MPLVAQALIEYGVVSGMIAGIRSAVATLQYEIAQSPLLVVLGVVVLLWMFRRRRT